MTMPRGRWLSTLKLIVGFGILIWLIWQLDWSELLMHTGDIVWPMMPLLILMCAMDRVFMAYKWNVLLRANRIVLPLHRVLGLYLVSTFLGSFTPGNIGGDAYRVMAISSHGRRAAVLSTVLIERVIGLLSVLLIGISALPFYHSNFGYDAIHLMIVAVVLIALTVMITFLPLSPVLKNIIQNLSDRYKEKPIIGKIQRLRIAYADQHRSKKILAFFLFLTIAEVLFFFFRNFVTLHSVNVAVPFSFVLVVMPIAYIVLRLPISIQGIGIQEGLFAFVAKLAGYDIEQGILVSLVWRAVIISTVYVPAFLLWCKVPGKLEVPNHFLKN